MPTSTTRPVAVKLKQDIHKRIKYLADARDRTTHWMMCEAIEQYVVREEKHEAFLQDGIRAWNEYQSTGLHVTQEEASAWLTKLAAGEDLEPPECHV